jgi:hypothetical protein
MKRSFAARSKVQSSFERTRLRYLSSTYVKERAIALLVLDCHLRPAEDLCFPGAYLLARYSGRACRCLLYQLNHGGLLRDSRTGWH